MAKYVLKKTNDGRFYFTLIADNGERVLTSEVFRSKPAALTGIQRVRQNAPSDQHYERRTSKSGLPYFVLKEQDNGIIATSEEYSSEAARDSAIAAVKAMGQAAGHQELPSGVSLRRLSVQNFRSIARAEVDFAPITVFYGPTASGKSSLLYSLLVLRNFVLNPNQPVDGFFNLGTFQSLGGFEACIFNHDVSKGINIEATFSGPQAAASFGTNLRKADCDIMASYGSYQLETTAALPYAVNQAWSSEISHEGKEFGVSWNGFASSVSPKDESPANQATARILAERLNFSAEALRSTIDICPHIRGFTQSTYAPVAVSTTPTKEDEVASLIVNDQYAAGRISVATQEIFEREFRTYTAPGTSTTSFQTTEVRGARVPGLLVNDGFGVNQVIYMLAKMLRPGIKTILVEEPEVHLHPTVVRKLARFMTRIAAEDERQLILTTHSGQLLLSLLAAVREGLLGPDDLACYQVRREGRASAFERERVSSDGQVSDGLSSFIAPELEDLKSLTKSPE